MPAHPTTARRIVLFNHKGGVGKTTLTVNLAYALVNAGRRVLLIDVPDLAGVRLLHLHMRQMEKLHPLIIKVFSDEGYVLDGKPEAKTWDLEYETMFKKLGLEVVRNESLYTSVHYVIKQNSTTRRLCELQVRTLAEEVWGEISHKINYPHETDSVACKEQLKVLARLVSGCSRLVDSIVVSYEDHKSRATNGGISPKLKR